MSARLKNAAWPTWLGTVLVAVAAAWPAPISWREAVVAGTAGLVGLALREGAAARLVLAFGIAVLGATSVTAGGEGARAAAMTAAIAAVLWLLLARRSGGLKWPPLLAGAVGLGGLAAIALPIVTSHLANVPVERAAGLVRFPAVVTSFAALLLFFSWERPRAVPRLFLVLVLAVPATTGLALLVQARSALAEAKRTHAPEELERSVDLARRAGWSKGEREAAVLWSRELLRLDRPAEALAALPETFVNDSTAHLIRAEALRRSGDGPAAMAGFARALAFDRAVEPTFTGEGRAWLGLWESRRGARERARSLLEAGLDSAEGDRYAAELSTLLDDAAEAASILDTALAKSPRSRFALCARARLAPTESNARACLDEVPMHGPSLRTLAESGDETAARLLARAAELPASETEFDGLIALRGVRVSTTQVTPGTLVPIELSFEVLRTPSPGEQYVVSLHFDGPTFFAGDHLVPVERKSPSWVAGELFRYSTDVMVPVDAAAGSYPVHLSLYSPASQVRLQPSGMPGHLKIVRIATLEVAR